MQVMYVWQIFEHPADYPDQYVVRRFAVTPGAAVPDTEPWCVTTTLRRARASTPRGLYRLGRSPEDEPQILETWI